MDQLSENRYIRRVKSDLVIKPKVFSLLFHLVFSFLKLHSSNIELHSLFDVEVRLIMVIMGLGELHLDLLDLLEVFVDLVS